MKGNAIIGQFGGPTSVINSRLAENTFIRLGLMQIYLKRGRISPYLEAA